jgi:16S rRNA (guanine527-N7)-methyltransferase
MSISAFHELGLAAPQTAALEAHYELLCRWNRVLNLTRIDRLEEALERHYGESLFLASRVPPGRIVDIGSGAGFPGFVVAVARPDCLLTLVESHQRKAVFLREASRKVPNVRVLAQRAEDVSEAFDCLISRAVSYSDLSSSVGRLARKLVLLTGAEEPPADWPFCWAVEPLSSARNRFLRIGEIVSRETAPNCFT